MVALNGYNDIATADKHRMPGRTYPEEEVAQRLELGGRGFWEEVVGLGRHSALVTRLGRMIRPGRSPEPPRLPPEALCADVARYYHSIARAADALGREWGFAMIHLLQPIHSASHKAPTAWERTLGVAPLRAQCATAIEAEMTGTPGFVSLTGMFDAETSTVFVDQNAHVTEAANRQIARRITDLLMPLLTRPGTSAGSEP